MSDRGIDRARAVFQFAGEAVVQAAELRLLGLAQIEVGEQPPQRDREVAHQRLLDLAEPADEAGRASRRGMRLVRRKLMSSCSIRRRI